MVRTLARGLRPRGRALLTLRRRHPTRAVHEPVVLPLPPLSAHAARAPVVSPNEGDVRLTAWVRGRVQGVGMRWWIRARALDLGLAGWATNLDDGRVEVVAEGTRAAAERLLGQLRGSGAPGRVEGVTERWSEPRGVASGFSEK